MAECCNHFSFTDDGDSFESWQGLRGPAGPAGPPGRDVQLRGPVATVYDLPVTAPASELWQVGTQAPYNGYFFNGAAWVNLGPVAAGATFTPTVSADGVISWTNDGGLPNPESVNIKGPQGETGATGATGPAGQDGTDGSDGVTFTPTVSSDGTLSWTNDGGLPNPESVNIKGPQGETGATGATGPAGPGVPAGGTAGQVLTKTGAADYATGWQDPSGGDVTADMLGIVIDGNSTPVGASVGQYVIVKNSTITGITNGLYTAAQAIPANTAIDSTYLSAVSNGGLNALGANVYSFQDLSSLVVGASGVTVSNCSVVKYGKIVVASLRAYTSSGIAGGSIIAKGLPAPPTNIESTARTNFGNYYPCFIWTDGTLDNRNVAIPADNAVYVNIAYATND